MDNVVGGVIPGVLGLICTVHAILQKMERDAKAAKTKFNIQAQLFETEEVLVEICGCKVSTNELITTIVERSLSIGTGFGRECWTEQIGQM